MFLGDILLSPKEQVAGSTPAAAAIFSPLSCSKKRVVPTGNNKFRIFPSSGMSEPSDRIPIGHYKVAGHTRHRRAFSGSGLLRITPHLICSPLLHEQDGSRYGRRRG